MSPLFSFNLSRLAARAVGAAGERPRVVFVARPRPPQAELRLAVSDLTARVRELRAAGAPATRETLRAAADALVEHVSTLLGAGWGEQPRHVTAAREGLEALMLGLIALLDEGVVAPPAWRDVLSQVHAVRRHLDAMTPAEIRTTAASLSVLREAVAPVD